MEGKWVVDRSDGVCIIIETPHTPLIIGRDKKLPTPQQIKNSTKYISKHHIILEWRPPSLFIKQIGKNPTFYSINCLKLPEYNEESKQELEFRPCEKEEEEEKKKTNNSNIIFVTREETENYALISTKNNKKEILPCTIYFPEELLLPKLTLRYIILNSNTTHSNSSNIVIKVPQNWLKDNDEEEEENNGKININRGWRGILDTVLLEEKQEQEKKKNEKEDENIIIINNSNNNIVQILNNNNNKDKENNNIEFKNVNWEWKCRSNGNNDDPQSWKPYSSNVSQIIEKAYREGKNVVEILDDLMFENPFTIKKNNSSNSSYSICFNEASLNGAMIQFQNKNKHKYRLIRRCGGDEIDRSNIPKFFLFKKEKEESETESEDTTSTSTSSSSDNEYTTTSSTTSSSTSSSSEDESFSSSSSEDSSIKNKKRIGQKRKRR